MEFLLSVLLVGALSIRLISEPAQHSVR